AKGFRPPQNDTVGNDQSRDHREWPAPIVGVGLEDWVYNYPRPRHNHQLHDNPDAVWNQIAHYGYYHIAEGYHRDNRDSHNHRRLKLYGNGQCRTNSQNLYSYGIVVVYGVRE